MLSCRVTEEQQCQALFFTHYHVFLAGSVSGCLSFQHLLLPRLRAGAAGLYFPQNEYTETVYVGQPAGTAILQVHAMLDDGGVRPHFYLCWGRPFRRPVYSSWFHLDVNTGILSLNKSLEESDFALLSELRAHIM